MHGFSAVTASHLPCCSVLILFKPFLPQYYKESISQDTQKKIISTKNFKLFYKVYFKIRKFANNKIGMSVPLLNGKIKTWLIIHINKNFMCK